VNPGIRALAAAGRGLARLLPDGRREWIEAVWAEAHEVPPGLPRLAWRAGGIWMLARETLRPRRLAKAALFAAAAAAAAWAAWPTPGVGHAAVSQFHAIATVLLLAGLPLLARRFLGPASPSRAGRALRLFCCAALLAFLPALAVVEAFANLTPARPAYRRVFCGIQGCAGVPGQSTGGPPWAGEIVLLLLTIGYVGVVLFLTSRRSLISRSTLAIGTGTGLLLGVVMYLVAPLGLNNYATNPWLPGAEADPLVALAWILLFGGPAVAAGLAIRRHRAAGAGGDRAAGGDRPQASFRIDQGIAAGLLANLTGALLVTALGTSTVALMLESAGLRHWLSHGQQLTAIATYHAEIYAGANVFGYILIWISFPVIGLIVGAAVASVRADSVPSEPSPGAVQEL
jgi:hypothetical protein